MLLRASASSLVLGVSLATACGGDTSEPTGGSNGASGSSGMGGTNGSSGSGGTGGTNGSSGSGGTNGTGSNDGGDLCSLPAEVGNCRASIPRFWFNSASGRCESFTYGGCGGNANNFESPAACVEACAPGTNNACSKIACAEGAECVFVGTRPAECLYTCADPGACPPNRACQCGGSCPGCENCIMVCVPV